MIQTLQKLDLETWQGIREEMKVRGTSEVFLLFSMGSQFDHLIKQHLDRLGVFCLVADPASVNAGMVRELNPTGIIVSGGPASVHSEPPPFDNEIFDIGIPVLGICLGFQMWAAHRGLTVSSGNREYGPHTLQVHRLASLFALCPDMMPVLESHSDHILAGGEMIVLGSTANATVAAGELDHLVGVQFHPEVPETTFGSQMFENFCFQICGAKDRFPAEKVAERQIDELRVQIGDKKVLLALSGGSDSSVVAYLLKHAVRENPGQIKGVYIKGVDRPDDERHVIEFFGSQPWLEVEIVDATEQFLAELAGIETMAAKRKAMKAQVYSKILAAKAAEFGAAFVAQGTLYTDISESGGGYNTGARKAVIKIHHNTDNDFGVPELTPLDDCVKDGGRNIGRIIGVPEELLTRHPFLGPGLILRIEGVITAEKLATARRLDDIYIEELRKWDLYRTVWQAGVNLLASVTTCTRGDDKGTGAVAELFAVHSVNGFTATWAALPEDFLRHVSRRITNEIREVGKVDYRISDKPPATIEMG